MGARISKRQVSRLWHRFISVLGLGALPIGILAPLDPTWWMGNWWPIVALMLAGVAWAALGLIPGEPEKEYAKGVKIRLVVGDLFEQKASAVVGFTTTFDTRTPDIIASNSAQGDMLQKVFGGDVDRLDAAIGTALHGKKPTQEKVNKVGKQVRYPIGTVAALQTTDGHYMYCTAYTTMDSNNNAHGDICSVLVGLDSAWEAADKLGNKAAICVPLLGQGQSRIPELTAEVAVRLTVFSFLLRSARGTFSKELRIVIQPSDRHKINFPEFQAFLESVSK